MKYTLLLIAAITALPCTAVELTAPTTFSSGDPGLVIVKRDVQSEGLLTSWRGRVKLRGYLVLEFRRVAPERNELFPEGASYFEPDTASLIKLPTARTNLPASPSVIELRKTPREILSSVLRAKEVDAIVNGQLERYRFPVTVSVVSFATSIDCDRRNYSLEYDKIVLLSTKVVAAGSSQNLSC